MQIHAAHTGISFAMLPMCAAGTKVVMMMTYTDFYDRPIKGE
jgi:hypothetical protein